VTEPVEAPSDDDPEETMASPEEPEVVSPDLTTAAPLSPPSGIAAEETETTPLAVPPTPEDTRTEPPTPVDVLPPSRFREAPGRPSTRTGTPAVSSLAALEGDQPVVAPGAIDKSPAEPSADAPVDTIVFPLEPLLTAPDAMTTSPLSDSDVADETNTEPLEPPPLDVPEEIST